MASLSAFWEKHPDARVSLSRWATVVKAAEWRTTAEVQAAFSKAKVLDVERVRFEIAGGSYRLIVAFKFRAQIAFVKFIGTHEEYDKIDALTVSQFGSRSMDIRPIRDDDDHRAAVLEIEKLWDCPDNSPEADRMDVLATLVDSYEAQRWPVTAGSPQDILLFAINEMGRTQGELADVLGSRSQASDLLKGRRRVSLATARKISRAWAIPIQLLVAPYEADAA